MKKTLTILILMAFVGLGAHALSHEGADAQTHSCVVCRVVHLQGALPVPTLMLLLPQHISESIPAFVFVFLSLIFFTSKTLRSPPVR